MHKRFLRKGFPLVVHDIRDEAARPLIDMGAEWGADPADVLARVDVVVTMVFGPKEVEQVARGENGLFSADCGGKTWIDLTTSSPSLMRALGQEFAERGGYPIDAPVTWAVDGAIRGDMLMFVGGDDAAVERVSAVVIEAMGEIRRVGKHGNAYVAKLVNNMLWKVHAAAIGEAMVRGQDRRAGARGVVGGDEGRGGGQLRHAPRRAGGLRAPLRPLLPHRALPQGSGPHRRADAGDRRPQRPHRVPRTPVSARPANAMAWAPAT